MAVGSEGSQTTGLPPRKHNLTTDEVAPTRGMLVRTAEEVARIWWTSRWVPRNERLHTLKERYRTKAWATSRTSLPVC